MLLVALLFLLVQIHGASATGMGLKDSLAVQDTSHLASNIVTPPFGTDRRLAPGIFDMITNLPRDWRDWSVQTFRLSNWPEAALVTASTVALVIYDNQLWKPFEKWYGTNTTFQNLSDGFVFIGDGKFQFGVAGIFAGYGLIAGDERALRTASQTCEVILAAGGVVQLLKYVTGRESPFCSTTPTGKWQLFPPFGPYFQSMSRFNAFPSGHLTTALATLTVIANNYPEQTWIRPVGYVACAGLSVGLVAQSIHWWSDFPLAIALGYGFGTLLSPNPNGDVSVTTPEKKKDMGFLERVVNEATISPSFQYGQPGLAMSWQF